MNKELLKNLEDLINNRSIAELIITGMVRKGLIGRENQYRFIVYSNDHNPAHFHVESKDGSIKAKYLMEPLQCLSGGNTRLDEFVRAWHSHPDNKSKAISEWNRFQKDKMK